MILYCSKAHINTDKNIHQWSTDITITDSKVQELVVVAFVSITVEKLVYQRNIVLISPEVIADGKIDLSCHDSPRIRSSNKDYKDFYGLPGYPGSSGYNLSIITRSNLHNIDFRSTGSAGGPGQDGNPPGSPGIGGPGGHLIINNKIITKGLKGNDGTGNNGYSYGIEHPLPNTFGFKIDMHNKKYRYTIENGIIKLNLQQNKDICTFFDF